MKRINLLCAMALAVFLVTTGCQKEQTPPESDAPKPPQAKQANQPDVSTALRDSSVLPDNAPAAPAPKPFEPPLPPVADEVTKLVNLVGDGYLLTLFLRPNQWATAKGGFAPLTTFLSSLSPTTKGVLESPSAEAVLQTLSGLLGIEGFPPALPGWDQTRPVVVGLFASDLGLSSANRLAQLWYGSKSGYPGLRCRIVIPASAPKALAKSLSQFLTLQLPRTKVEKALDAGLHNTAIYSFETGWLTVRPSSYEVLLDVQLADSLQDANPQARHQRIQHWLRHEPTTPEWTPGLHFAASSKALFSGRVDLSQLRPVSVHHGLSVSARALGEASSDFLLQMKGMVLATLVGSWSLMDPRSLILRDIGLALHLDQGTTVETVSTLSPWAATALEIAQTKRSGRFPTILQPALGWLELDLDLGSLLTTALPLHPALDDLDLDGPSALEKQELLRSLVQTHLYCGPACSLHLLAGGWTRIAASFASTLDSVPLPRALRLTLHSLGETAEDAPKVTLASLVDSAPDTLLIRKSLADLDRELNTLSQLVIRDIQNTRWLTVGINADPNLVFGQTLETTGDASILRAHVFPHAIANAITPVLPELASLFDGLGSCTLSVSQEGPALTATVRLPLKDAAPAPSKARYNGYTWRRKAPPEAAPDAGPLLMHLVGMMEAFGKGQSDTLNTIDTVLGALEERPDMAEFKAYLAAFGADLANAELNLPRRDLYLANACKAGYEAACSPQKIEGYLPAPKLATLSDACSLLAMPPKHFEVAIKADGVQIGTKLVPGSDETELPVQLEKQFQQHGRTSSVFVLIDPDTPFLTFKQFYLTAQNLGLETVHALFENPGKTMSAVSLRLPPDFKMDAQASIQVGNLSVGIDRFGHDDVDLLEFDLKGGAPFPERLREALGSTLPRTVELGALNDTPWKNVARTIDALVCGVPAGGAPLLYVEAPQPEEPPHIRKEPLDNVEKQLMKDTELLRLLGTGDTGAGLGDTISKGAVDELASAFESLESDLPDLDEKKEPSKLAITQPRLDKDIVKVVRRHHRRIRGCYEKQLKVSPKLATKVTVYAEIGKNGKVTKAEIVRPDKSQKAMEKCIRKVFLKMRFPATDSDEKRSFNMPFILSTN